MKERCLKGWIFLVIIACVAVACEKRQIYNPDKDDNLPAGVWFDFSTAQKIKMGIAYDVPAGYRVVFDIYDQLPMVEKNGKMILNPDLQPIAGGVTNGYGKYELEKILPATVKDFYVYTSDLFATTLMHGKIEEGQVRMESVDLASLRKETSATVLATRGAAQEWLTLGTWDGNGKPNYIAKDKKIDVSDQTLKQIKNYFPDEKRANSAYFKTTDLYVADSAEIWLTVIGSAGTYNNTLGYYCYTGQPENVKPENVKKIIAFPRAKLDSYCLKSEQCIQLKYYNPENGRLETTFPKGVSIGWVLISDGFVTSKYPDKYAKGEIRYNNPYFYSNASWNPEKKNAEHMILFKTKNRGEDFVAFGFEDTNNKEGDQDCNDVMFHVQANPIDAIIEEIPDVPETPEEDIVKDEIYRGTLAFEDLWPCQGDYDLNDVVVKYKSTATTIVEGDKDYDTYGRVAKVKDEFSLIWSGALVHNAFGYQMHVGQVDIKSLKVFCRGEEMPTAWDRELDKVTIMLTVDVLKEIGMSSGRVVDYTVEIEFSESVLVKDFSLEKAHAPYNPFIVSKGGLETNRVEVHLPTYEPTSKNNMELLGTADDRSEAGSGKYYMSEKKYPFALHILGDNDFINKGEAVRIDATYPKFRNWVNKEGKEDQDWYKYPVEE